MKLKLTLLPLALLCATITIAQSGNKTLDSKLAVYAEKVKVGNYYEAVIKLNEVRQLTDSLIATQVSAALPKEVGDWALTNDSKASAPLPSGPMPQSGTQGNAITVSRFYRNKKEVAAADSVGKQMSINDPHAHAPNEQMDMFSPTMFVTITNNPMEISTVLMMYSDDGQAQGPSMPGSVSKSLKIKNHRAVMMNNLGMKTCELTIIVGASVVKVIGQALKDNADMEKVANAIDFSKIKAILGE